MAALDLVELDVDEAGDEANDGRHRAPQYREAADYPLAFQINEAIANLCALLHCTVECATLQLMSS